RVDPRRRRRRNRLARSAASHRQADRRGAVSVRATTRLGRSATNRDPTQTSPTTLASYANSVNAWHGAEAADASHRAPVRLRAAIAVLRALVEFLGAGVRRLSAANTDAGVRLDVAAEALTAIRASRALFAVFLARF